MKIVLASVASVVALVLLPRRKRVGLRVRTHPLAQITRATPRMTTRIRASSWTRVATTIPRHASARIPRHRAVAQGIQAASQRCALTLIPAFPAGAVPATIAVRSLAVAAVVSEFVAKLPNRRLHARRRVLLRPDAKSNLRCLAPKATAVANLRCLCPNKASDLVPIHKSKSGGTCGSRFFPSQFASL